MKVNEIIDDTRLPRETKYQRDDRLGRTPTEPFPEPSIEDVTALASCNGGNFSNARHHARLANQAGLKRMQAITPDAYDLADADRATIRAKTESFNAIVRATVDGINATQAAMIAAGSTLREADRLAVELEDVKAKLESPSVIELDPVEAFRLTNLAKHLPAKIEAEYATALTHEVAYQRLAQHHGIDLAALVATMKVECRDGEGRIVNNDWHDLIEREYVSGCAPRTMSQ